MSNANRDRGHDYERKIMNELKPFFPDVKTSRNESKLLDDLKIDLAFTDPFTIQCKATERTPPYVVILKEMKKAFKDKMPLLFHKRVISHTETVTMRKSDFYYLLLLLNKNELL